MSTYSFDVTVKRIVKSKTEDETVWRVMLESTLFKHRMTLVLGGEAEPKDYPPGMKYHITISNPQTKLV
jgi:hypothetical protein